MERNFETDFILYLRENYGAIMDLGLGVMVALNERIIPWDVVPFSMRWGVYVDFFDEQDIYICVDSEETRVGEMKYYGCIQDSYDVSDTHFFDTLEEARKSAFEQAVQIYNKKQV